MLRLEQADEIVTFDDAVERLVEAWGFLRRMPDREGGWMRGGGVSSLYRQQVPTLRERWQEWGFEAALAAEREAAKAGPRLPPLSTAEVGRMNEALDWIEAVTPRDRRLVGMVLAQLDRGRARPAWRALAHDLGWGGHPDTLARRFDRAVAAVAARANGAKTADFSNWTPSSGFASTPPK